MNKVLYLILISLFSLTIFSCNDDKEEFTDTDTTAPVIAEVTVVTTPTTDSTPNYTFSSTEAGTIAYGGSCSSSTTTATTDNNTITLISLSNGTYSNCTITVTDTAGNASNTLAITSFVVIPSYVAVGAGGTILASSDGTAWATQTSGTTTRLNGVSYVNSTFVAVGAGGTILTSSDGTSWTSRTSGVTIQLFGVTSR